MKTHDKVLSEPKLSKVWSQVYVQCEILKSAHGWRCFSFKNKRGTCTREWRYFCRSYVPLYSFISWSTCRRDADVKRPLPSPSGRKKTLLDVSFIRYCLKLFTFQLLSAVYLWVQRLHHTSHPSFTTLSGCLILSSTTPHRASFCFCPSKNCRAPCYMHIQTRQNVTHLVSKIIKHSAIIIIINK